VAISRQSLRGRRRTELLVSGRSPTPGKRRAARLVVGYGSDAISRRPANYGQPTPGSGASTTSTCPVLALMTCWICSVPRQSAVSFAGNRRGAPLSDRGRFAGGISAGSLRTDDRLARRTVIRTCRFAGHYADVLGPETRERDPYVIGAKPAVAYVSTGNKHCRFAGISTGATGLEPATYDPDLPSRAGISSTIEPATTGCDRLAPGTACVECVWSSWCLLRQRWMRSIA
jgi:hypothetical protein